MKQKRLYIAMLVALMAVLAMAFPATAFASHLNGSTNWLVEFGTDGKMTDNFSNKTWADEVGGLQPGDDITFTINLSHKNSTACDWYMSNEVLKSLEEGVAKGSAYGYVLTYEGPSDSRTLYNSNIVGGDNTSGLSDATSGLEDFFFLDNLKKDQTGAVKLVVSLDGETEGNAYFDSLAQLKMKFAVEMPTNNNNNNNNSGTSSGSRTSVQTGDETNLFPFYVVMIVAGLGLLALGVTSVRRNKREQAGNHSRSN